MKPYRYFLPASAMWATFDCGIVKADNEQEALEKAKERLKYDLDKVNHVLDSADVTAGFVLEIDVNTVEVKLL